MRAAGGVVEEGTGAVDRAGVLEVAGDDEDFLGAGDVVVEAGPLGARGEVDLEGAFRAVLPEVADLDVAEGAGGGVASVAGLHAGELRGLRGDEAVGVADTLDLEEVAFRVFVCALFDLGDGQGAEAGVDAEAVAQGGGEAGEERVIHAPEEAELFEERGQLLATMGEDERLLIERGERRGVVGEGESKARVDDPFEVGEVGDDVEDRPLPSRLRLAEVVVGEALDGEEEAAEEVVGHGWFLSWGRARTAYGPLAATRSRSPLAPTNRWRTPS